MRCSTVDVDRPGLCVVPACRLQHNPMLALIGSPRASKGRSGLFQVWSVALSRMWPSSFEDHLLEYAALHVWNSPE